jgi:DNA polymerase
VGKAGQLLNRIIQAIGLEREDVYIANVVKSRPPGNRNPEPDEIATCMPFLERQIESVGPAVLVTLGNVPTKALLGTETGIMKMRGSWREWRGIPLMPTFHPAYLLRNPEDKRLVWEDMLQVAERYNRELPAGEKACRPKTRAAEASEG